MYVHSEDVYDGVLWRTFRQDDGSVVTGHPYLSEREEAGADGWYAVIRQDVPFPPYLNGDMVNTLKEQELWRDGPYQYRWQAREAGWMKLATTHAAHMRAWSLSIGNSEQEASELAQRAITRRREILENEMRPVWNSTSGRKAAARRATWWAEVENV